MLTSKQRAFLRSKATALTTSFQIGKGGVNENMLASIEAALLAHELVKVKCLENCEYTAKEAMEGIAAAIDAEEVQVVGNKFILFKISPEKRRYDLDKLCEIEEKKEKKPAKKEAVKGTKKPGSGAYKSKDKIAAKGAPAAKAAQGGRPEKYGYQISKRKG